MRKIKTAVMVSGGGTNLAALIKARDEGKLPSCELSLVVSNVEGAYALERAAAAGIETAVVTNKGKKKDVFCSELLALLQAHDIEFIVLGGFLAIFNEDFVAHYPDRIINVHPALIPSFCGKGFYGLHVHQAVLDYGVKVSGATVHYVNEITDGGRIILQKAVDIDENETPESLQRKIMEQCEWELLPKATEMVCEKLSREVNE